MRLRLLDILACPDCGGGLSLSGASPATEPVTSARLVCSGCRRDFPVVDGIPRMLDARGLGALALKTRESFGYEWMRYPGSSSEDKPILLAETQVPEGSWAGRLVLDGGCGMGRYARAALEMGAEVVAFDLSDSLLRLRDRAARDPKLHLVQGDLLKPPFKRGSFDIVYSIGVIHHTESAEEAFKSLSALPRADGLLSVWVYGTPGPYSSFSTNPLRPGRARLKPLLPLVWAVVWTRQVLSDALRVLTTRLPSPLLYALCYPLTWLGAVPVLKYLTYSVHPDFRVRLIENFDWLAPPYQSKHVKEEVRAWFEAGGFEVLGQLSHGVVPKVGFLGRKKRA